MKRAIAVIAAAVFFAATSANSNPTATWHPLQLRGQWHAANDGGLTAPEYLVDADGFIHLKGHVSTFNDPTSFRGSNVVAVLPPAARPHEIWTFLSVPVPTGQRITQERVVIHPDGNVKALWNHRPNVGEVYLDGLTAHR